jgi:hypothetical protein
MFKQVLVEHYSKKPWSYVKFITINIELGGLQSSYRAAEQKSADEHKTLPQGRLLK